MGRTRSWSHKGVELMRAQDCINALVTRQPQACGARIEVRLVRERALFLRFQELLLSEPKQFGIAVFLVELDQVGEGAGGGRRSQRRQVGVHIRLEFIAQDLDFHFLDIGVTQALDRVDQFRAKPLHLIQRRF